MLPKSVPTPMHTHGCSHKHTQTHSPQTLNVFPVL